MTKTNGIKFPVEISTLMTKNTIGRSVDRGDYP